MIHSINSELIFCILMFDQSWLYYGKIKNPDICQCFRNILDFFHEKIPINQAKNFLF